MKLFLFGHSKCIPCQQLKKEFEKRRIPYLYIDVEKEPQKAIDYMISSVPTLIVEDGKGTIKEMCIGNGQGIWDLLKKYKIIKEDK